MPNLSKSYVLLTGSTGLVGRYLVKDLLLAGYNLALLVRPSERLSAPQRVENILQFWERETGKILPRPVVLRGDITQENFGLSNSDLRWVTENCDTAIHNAAVLSFHGKDQAGEPWRTNLGGAKNFVELARNSNISNWHFVSTAYVCGRRDGTIREDELDCGQKFRNDYEESKFEAEKLVRAAAEGFAKLTVFRPAVIVGDSKTGYTSSYHGLFLYLRLIATLVPQQPRDENGVLQTPITLPINGDEPRNLVAVDWVSKVISRLVDSPEAHGKTFHLSPDRFITARKVIDYCYQYFNSDGVQFAGEGDKQTEAASSSFAEKFFENSRIYESYQSEDPEFDRTNLVQHAGDIACPEIDRDLIFRFIEFGTEDNWGKRREQPPKVPVWFGEKLINITLFDFLDPVKKAYLGIDIQGPGGGQWCLEIDGESRKLTRGLPSNATSVITLDANDLAEKVESEFVDGKSFWQKAFASST